MIRNLTAAEFLEAAVSLPVIDVRSPGEYRIGHIPDSFNVPLFDDAERAVIGTIYKHNGKEVAIEKGLQIAQPKIQYYLEQGQAIAPGKDVLLHCWRGGMRSGEMAALYNRNGFNVGLLVEGYKGYRRFIRSEFSQRCNVIVIGGHTGSGKTAILHALKKMGEQVVDLEGISCHKGSVFGALGQLPQPTNEQFGNDLYQVWRWIDRSRNVWIEDESRMIGMITLPEEIFQKIDHGVMIRVIIDKALRIHRLVEEYSVYDSILLHEAISRIKERLGGAAATEAHVSIDRGNFTRVAEISLSYYDKAYEHAVARRGCRNIFDFIPSDPRPEAVAEEVLLFIKEIQKHEPDLFGL